jgi:type II secretory pathway pseudopilin PulG
MDTMKKPLFLGFSLIEMLVIITVIGILATISVLTTSNIQSDSRNDKRSSALTLISEALEQYYKQNGEYPSCADMTQSADIVSTQVLTGLDPAVLATPNATSNNSFVCTDPGDGSDVYVYLYGNTKYTLKANKENSSDQIVINSRHSL